MDQAIITLNEGWRFHYGDVPEAWYRGYDDRDWEEVFLPHDWSVHMPFQKEYSSGTGYLAGGIGWYRLRFSLPEEYRGKHVQIVFDGIYKNSRIWCNSYHLGKRPYGYSEISYDITDFVNFGDIDNEISVQVTHTDLADSRWFTGSGIYRKVWLIVEEKVHPVLHGTQIRTNWIRWDTVEAEAERNADQAEIGIRAEFANDTEQDCCLHATFRLMDRENHQVASWEKQIRLSAGKTGAVELKGIVEHPRLWSMDDPYLYTMETGLSEGAPEEAAPNSIDEPRIAGREKIGIRTAKFDPDTGFFLNGRNQKLRGVCVHHDGGCLGAAMYREVWLRRLLKLKEAGCNAIRTSHNPHMPELYDLCDELGFLVMDEAFDEWENPKNKWSTGHNVYPPKHQGYAEDFPQWYEADLTTMIRRDWNHPSIILWSIGNEIDYPNDPYCHPGFQSMVGNNDAAKPAAEMQYNPDKPNAERLSVLAARLAEIARKTDDSRPVTLAAAFPELSSRIGFLDELDVVGYNYKEHLYEQDHVRFPEKPFLGSENGHSYQAWRAVTDHPYISGQFLWTGIDYLGEAHGWPIHGSGAGLLDLAGNEKPGYYSRRAWWSEAPYLGLLTAPADAQDAEDRRKSEWRPFRTSWNYMEGEQVDVYCFTNRETVELFLNGRSLGEGEWNEACGRREWSVAYEPGILKAIARDGADPEETQEITSLLETADPAAQLEAVVWKPIVRKAEGKAPDAPAAESICECASGMGMAESQPGVVDAPARVAQIEVALLDADGRLAAGPDLTICADVENGTLLGLENGDLADLTPYTENRRKTRGGRLILYVRVREGESARVKVSCEELGQTRELEIA